MQEIIKEIINIEKRAQAIEAQAIEAASDLPGKIEAEAAAYERLTEEKYRTEYEGKRGALIREYEDAGRRADAESERKCTALREAYEKHSGQWVKTLYESVIKNG